MRRVFVWNTWNVEHISKHGVPPEEAKYVVEHASGKYPQRTRGDKYVVKGATRSGRWLQVIYIVLEDDEVDVELMDLVERTMVDEGDPVLFVIHARELSLRERRRA